MCIRDRDQRLGVSKVDVRNLGRDHGQCYFQQGQLGPTSLLQVVEDAGQHLAQQPHDREVVVDETELHVETDVLVDVADGVVRLGAKDRDVYKRQEHDEVAHWLINRDILAGEHAIYFSEAYGHEALYHYCLLYTSRCV